MKFGAIWKQRWQGLPPSYREDTIHYKQWKKSTKTPLAPNEFLQGLKQECERVHRRFLHEMRVSATSRSNLLSFCRPCPAVQVAPAESAADTETEVKTLYEFAELNRTCLYKLCKRYDKRLQANRLRPWLSQVLSEGSYAFLNRLHIRRLELQLFGNDKDECPICFESLQAAGVPPSPFVIFNCGHIMCLSCTLHLYRAASIQGTLRNRIAHGQYLYHPTCPVCRHPDPLENMTSQNVFPDCYANLVYKLNNALPRPTSA